MRDGDARRRRGQPARPAGSRRSARRTPGPARRRRTHRAGLGMRRRSVCRDDRDAVHLVQPERLGGQLERGAQPAPVLRDRDPRRRRRASPRLSEAYGAVAHAAAAQGRRTRARSPAPASPASTQASVAALHARGAIAAPAHRAAHADPPAAAAANSSGLPVAGCVELQPRRMQRLARKSPQRLSQQLASRLSATASRPP